MGSCSELGSKLEQVAPSLPASLAYTATNKSLQVVPGNKGMLAEGNRRVPSLPVTLEAQLDKLEPS